MTDRAEWMQCKAMSRAELRASGGCYWAVRANSPGNSIKVPSGTLFRIKYEGPESHVYVSGICEQAMFHVTQGSAAGSYPSASAAVNSVRSHVEKTNAYLYVEFKLSSSWCLADELRYDPELSKPVDSVEEKILEALRKRVREKYNNDRRKLSPEEVEEKAEIAFDRNPEYVKKMRKAYSGFSNDFKEG